MKTLKMIQERKEQRDALKQLEIKFRNEFNYEGLIDVYDKLCPISLTSQDHCNNIFKYAYCLARLGLKNQSAELINKSIDLINTHAAEFRFSMNPNEYYRAFTLLTFFTTNKHNIFVIKQTLLDWLGDSNTSQQVKDMIFDYELVLNELTSQALNVNIYKQLF